MGLISKCESYFDLDRTLDENKVVMVSLVLDEQGYQWYDGSLRGNNGPIGWGFFAEGIKIRFSNTLQRPLECS